MLFRELDQFLSSSSRKEDLTVLDLLEEASAEPTHASSFSYLMTEPDFPKHRL
jgi:hypothetical protein